MMYRLYPALLELALVASVKYRLFSEPLESIDSIDSIVIFKRAAADPGMRQPVISIRVTRLLAADAC